MFRIEKTGPNRIDIEFGGKLNVEEMRRALDELVSAAQGIEHGLMLFHVHDYRLPTLGAIALEFSRFFELLRMMRRFQ
jgi:hypothetical protein